MYKVSFSEPVFNMTSNRFFNDLDSALRFYRYIANLNYRCDFVEIA